MFSNIFHWKKTISCVKVFSSCDCYYGKSLFLLQSINNPICYGLRNIGDTILYTLNLRQWHDTRRWWERNLLRKFLIPPSNCAVHRFYIHQQWMKVIASKPKNPGLHWHWKSPMPSLHRPPFWHGAESHSSMSISHLAPEREISEAASGTRHIKVTYCTTPPWQRLCHTSPTLTMRESWRQGTCCQVSNLNNEYM